MVVGFDVGVVVDIATATAVYAVLMVTEVGKGLVHSEQQCSGDGPGLHSRTWWYLMPVGSEIILVELAPEC